VFKSVSNGLWLQVTDFNFYVKCWGRHHLPAGFEKFKVEAVPNTNSMYTIKSFQNKYMWVDRDLEVRAVKPTAQAWEHFQFKSAGNGLITIFHPSHACYFSEVWWTG